MVGEREWGGGGRGGKAGPQYGIRKRDWKVKTGVTAPAMWREKKKVSWECGDK